MSSGFKDAYFGILFLPFVMISVSSASDIFCTSAVVKSWAPIFFPIAEPVPSAPWQPAHFDLKSADASCAPADKGRRLRTKESAVAIVNTLRLILFIFKLRLSFDWQPLGIAITSDAKFNIELPERRGSVTPITLRC